MSFPQVPSPLCVFPSSLFVSLSISVSRSCVPNWDERSRRGRRRRKRPFLGPPRLRAGRRGDTWTEASVSRVGGEFTGFANCTNFLYIVHIIFRNIAIWPYVILHKLCSGLTCKCTSRAKRISLTSKGRWHTERDKKVLLIC